MTRHTSLFNLASLADHRGAARACLAHSIQSRPVIRTQKKDLPHLEKK